MPESLSGNLVAVGLDEHGMSLRWQAAINSAELPRPGLPETKLRTGLLGLIFRKVKSAVLLVGRPGAGKTVLAEGLLGKRNERTTRSTVQSLKPDQAEAKLRYNDGQSHKLGFMVVPGQGSLRLKQVRLQDWIRTGHPPRGVIYAVAFGYNRIWDTDQAFVKARIGDVADAGMIAALREYSLLQEVIHFENFLAALRPAWQRQRGRWLVIAVTHLDLFWTGVACGEAHSYYVRGTHPVPGLSVLAARFHEALQEFNSAVSDSLDNRIAILPTAYSADEYEFPWLMRRVPQAGALNRDAIHQHLIDAIGEYCEPSK